MVASRYYNDTPPPWFTPALYAFTSREHGTQCIAPTKEKPYRRCRSWITAAELVEVVALQRAICNSTDVLEIVQKTRQLVLARCCTFGSHRKKLSSSPECRRIIAERFIDEFTHARLLQVKVPRNLLLFDTNSIDGTLIVPYAPSDPQETIECVLRSRVVIGDESPVEGVAYAFALPLYQGIVKIGYSGRSAEARRRDQEVCMPNAELVVEKKFCFPERMERLIHLQLRAHRREIVRCTACQCTHLEFFQLPSAYVADVFHDWEALQAKEPLYSRGLLTKAWSDRLDKMTGDITASALLALLDKEVATGGRTIVKKEAEDVEKEVVLKEESTDVKSPFKQSTPELSKTVSSPSSTLIKNEPSVVRSDKTVPVTSSASPSREQHHHKVRAALTNLRSAFSNTPSSPLAKLEPSAVKSDETVSATTLVSTSTARSTVHRKLGLRSSRES